MGVCVTFTAASTDRMKKGATDYRDEGQHLLSGTTVSICFTDGLKCLFTIL